ncbi:MAG TPA: hypothetical protein DCX22_00105 [Dehalococcoidia bacterium]|nr:hypothetical protein [Dehalococcoidia bacterium]
MQSKVSIIIVNYNGMPHIDACISSALRQNYQNVEIIFVDNNSGDGSLDYARSKFPSLIFVPCSENTGYAGGINAGFAHATGDYIAPLNIDTEVDPDWLSALVAFLNANPGTGAVTPKILLFDQRDTINTKGLNIHVSGLGFCRSLNRKNDRSTAPERVSGISGCSYVIRREVFEWMGGAPEDCFMGNDDVIVSWLVNLMGYDLYCIPESIVYHKYTLKMNSAKFYALEKNRLVLLQATLKPVTLIACSPVFAIIELLITGYSIIKGAAYIKARFKAMSDALKDKDAVRRKRERYNRIRKITDFALLRRLRWNIQWDQLIKIV